MKYWSLCFLGTLCFSPIVHAQTTPCEDLFALTCAVGTRDDGTGAPKNSSASEAKALYDQKVRSVIENRFKAALGKPESSYLRDMALKTSKLNMSPECSSSEAADIARCNSNLANYLTVVAQNPPQNFNPGRDALSDVTYIVDHPIFTEITQQGAKDLIQQDPNFKKNEKYVRETAFPQIKKLLINKVSSLPIDEKQKSILTKKIQGIYFKGTDCSDNLYSSALDEVFVANGFYQPTENSFTVCKGYLGESFSDFSLAGLIAHELAHSIDPCQLQYAPEGFRVNYSNALNASTVAREYPVKGLIACLRSEKSVHARYYIPENKESARPSLASSKQASANASSGPQEEEHDVCHNDHITESIADWFAAEVATDYIQSNHPQLTKNQWINGFANYGRDLCGTDIDAEAALSEDQTRLPEHPTGAARVNKILLMQPQVRKKMGCKPAQSQSAIYCDASNPDAMSKVMNDFKPGTGLIPRSNATTSPASADQGVR